MSAFKIFRKKESNKSTTNNQMKIMARPMLFRRSDQMKLRRLIVACLLCSIFLALPVTRVSAVNPQSDAYRTTVTYVATFYPLWFTWRQASHGNNRLVGPERVSPLYHVVVAINDDTVYCSSYLNLDPNSPDGSPVMILTIPSTVSPGTCSDNTSVTYSILTLDPYCNVLTLSPSIPHGAPPIAGGTYALTGPDYIGTPPIPPGVTHILIPVNYPSLLFRIDKYHSFDPPNYVNQIHEADLLRLLLRLQTLDQYNSCPDSGGRTQVLPEIAFSIPYKTVADVQIANHPIAFLHELQMAVASPRTPPLSTAEQSLSDHFNTLFGHGGNQSDFALGAQAAHRAILDRYLTHLGPTNWIHFTNIGHWGNHVIERSSITEFIQYANDIEAAAYYHTFRDSAGRALDGNNPHGYVLTFPPAGPNQPYPGPETSRFWSLTAYTPEAIELVPNPINKYVVASYTGARLNPDGSLSVYMATERPAGVPPKNWLPIPNGPFNIMLRDYGPEGRVANDAYIPPAIEARP